MGVVGGAMAGLVCLYGSRAVVESRRQETHDGDALGLATEKRRAERPMFLDSIMAELGFGGIGLKGSGKRR